MQYELSKEESDLLEPGLYFSIQLDKIRKSEIFTIFEKIHRSFLNNLKSQETKSQINTHLSYLANSYFYNYKPSPRILRQHRVSQNLRKNKYIVITKPDKGNVIVIWNQKLYNNTIEEIISDTSKFEKLNEDTTLKREASLQRFYVSWYKKTFLMKLDMINCIFLVLLLLVFMVLLKCTDSPLVIHFLNFVRLFCLLVLLIIILPVSFVIFSHLYFLMTTLAKILFTFSN